MTYLPLFQMPKPVKIIARSSSITNAFVNGIIPCIIPTEQEVKEVLEILGMKDTGIKCSYCGGECTEWDHFRPLIKNKRPTGYISEIHNLVPACGKCNQSKGNSEWKTWIIGPATLSPKSRNIANLNTLIERLEAYEAWSQPRRIDFEHIVGEEKWHKHWENCDKLHQQMRETQILSDEIKEMLICSIKG